MAQPYYRIKGINILPYLSEGGLSWEENDIDAENSGRTMDGLMHRKIVTIKDKHTLTFRTLDVDEAQIVLNALSGSDYIQIQTNVHPKRRGDITLTMYNSSRKAAVYTLNEDGNSVWTIESVSLIER